MIELLKKSLLFLCLLIGLVLKGWGQEAYEFVDKDINEILYAVSLSRNFPISSDDTVYGNADFRCIGENFEDAFDSFLLKNRLYVVKSEKGWKVSRISFTKIAEDFEEETSEDGVEKIFDGEAEVVAENLPEKARKNPAENLQELFCLDGCDVSPARIFERISAETGVCITCDSLPQIKVSIHTGICGIDELVEKVAAACSGYDVLKDKNGFHVSRSSREAGSGNGRCDFRLNQDFSILMNLNGCSFTYALEKLFALTGNDFCIAAGSDAKLGRTFFTAENFEKALEVLCTVGNFQFSVSEGVYFFWPAKDKSGIRGKGSEWKSHSLKFVKFSEISGVLSKRFPEIELTAFPDDRKFMYMASVEEEVDFLNFIEMSDKSDFSRLIQLKYIRTADFVKNLPPFVSKNQVTDSGRGDSFYFSGTEEAYSQLVERLPEIDRPVSRIKYDLLIMQYQKVDGKSWSPNFRAGRLSIGDRNNVSGTLGSVLDLNLDVVSVFGRKFAFDLQSSINESKAKVYADTTLNGVSGATINFANTNTYRYRDNNLDPETGEPVYSGITKEIISGLKLEVTGIVTGDGMITSKITASVSRQGTDLSTTTGNPPPTSEKVITTEVRAKSGEPVVLSGLVQDEEVENVSRTPFLSRIPILGKLFRGEEKSKEQTELVIYLVPSADVWEEGGKDV